MDEVIAWATFAGAWLLVAGPLYQGSVEPSEMDFDREGIQGNAAAAGAARSRPSAWWWLLPPVTYVLRYRWYKGLQRAMMRRLTKIQREQFDTCRTVQHHVCNLPKNLLCRLQHLVRPDRSQSAQAGAVPLTGTTAARRQGKPAARVRHHVNRSPREHHARRNQRQKR